MSEQGPETEGQNVVDEELSSLESAPEEPVAQSAEPVEAPDENPEKSKKRSKIFIIGIPVLLVAIIGGVIYWIYARQFESTDDAFIEGDIVQISPKVAAYVDKIYVKANQYVHRGDPLVDLDQKELEVKLEQARAQLASAKSQRGQAKANVDLTSKSTNAGQSQAISNVETSQTNVRQTQIAAEAKQRLIAQARAVEKTAQATLAQTRAQVPLAESNVHLAQIEFERRRALFNNGDISRQALDQGTNALQTAQAELNTAQKSVLAAQSRVNEAAAGVAAAEENYRQALAQIDLTRSQVNESKGRLEDASAAPERIDVSQSQVETAEAGIAAAEAAVHEAELELSFTKIVAPEDGYVTRKTVQEGQLVAVGTPLMAISQSDDIWVVANFKETQLENMKVGQHVSITVDAYPGTSFEGKIDSFQLGTGSRFSVLPTENATGNYVKVVQRIPVKIVFDRQPADIVLAPGMSAEPTVKVR